MGSLSVVDGSALTDASIASIAVWIGSSDGGGSAHS